MHAHTFALTRDYLGSDTHVTTLALTCTRVPRSDMLRSSCNRDWLLSSSLDRTVRVWDGRSGAALTSWTGHKDAVMDLVVSRFVPDT
eukprot:1979931-Rhodomonas_salina.4